MSKIALVTDSTVSMPQELVEKYHIHVVPQVLIWEGKTYEDGIDISSNEVYRRLPSAKQMPTTSQAVPKSFHAIYTSLLEQGYEILTVVISSDLSGTIVSANQARENFPGAPIEIVDSRTTAMAMGFLVLQAARIVEQGASLQECKKMVEQNTGNTGVVFTPDTLEFLHRGGRIGGGKRLLGTALSLKPILELQHGKIDAIESVRTRRKSLLRVAELIEERIGGRRPLHLSTLHANAEAEAHQILNEFKDRFNADEVVFSEVSPVVGVHAGPGTVGFTFLAGW